MVDLKIFRRGFQLYKNASQTWSEDQNKTKTKKKKKNAITSFLSHFLLAAASLPFSSAPKPTHLPYFRVICALCNTNRRWLGARAFSEGFQLKPLQPPCIRHCSRTKVMAIWSKFDTYMHYFTIWTYKIYK